LVLLLVAGCERADVITEDVTAHFPWTAPPHVGELVTSQTHWTSSFVVPNGERHAEFSDEQTAKVLEVSNDRATKMRLDITRFVHTINGAPFGESLAGSFELLGDPITEVHRLDGRLSPHQEEALEDMRADCPPEARRLAGARVYRKGESVRVPPAEAMCLGFEHSAPWSVVLTLVSADGTSTEFDYVADFVLKGPLPIMHRKGHVHAVGPELTRRSELEGIEGARHGTWHIETTAHFTPAPKELPPVTGHFLWTSPRVGDTYTYKTHGVSTMKIGDVEHTGEFTREVHASTLEVTNERKTKERVEITRDDHTHKGPSVVGVFEVTGDPITSIRRLDGELSPEQRKEMMDDRADCSPTDGHAVAARTYRAGETVYVPDAEAKCMGFSRIVPGTLEVTLRSVTGPTTTFDYVVDYAARDGVPSPHVTGTLTFTGTQFTRADSLVMVDRDKSLRGHSETTGSFVHGPAN
jgi:hypothetical protein